MKSYDDENNKFISDYADMIDEYNNTNNCYLEDDLRNTYNNIISSKPKLSPSSFFHEVKSLISATQGNYESIDIVNYINCIFNDNGGSHSLLQNYFDDVKLEYERLEKEDLDYCEENRDAILRSNLKLVISIAKNYRNRGLSLEDLIGAGNVGLCVAWDKYNPEKNVLRAKIIKELEDCPDELTKDYIDSLLAPFVRYGDLKVKYEESFHTNKVYQKKEITKWITKNIKKAKFSSVAALWIRAYVLQELNTNSRIVKKPKSEIDKDLEEHGRYLKENIVPIDPLIDIDDKSNIQTCIELSENDDTDKIDNYENMVAFKCELNKLLVGVNNRDRRILFKCFGIGLPRSMQPREIAETEDLSVARVSQIVQDSLEKIRKNAKGKNINDIIKYLQQ